MIVIDAQLGGAVGSEREINTDVFDGDKPGAAFGPQFVVFQLFLRDLAIERGHIGAHRGHNNAVF